MLSSCGVVIIFFGEKLELLGGGGEALLPPSTTTRIEPPLTVVLPHKVCFCREEPVAPDSIMEALYATGLLHSNSSNFRAIGLILVFKISPWRSKPCKPSIILARNSAIMQGNWLIPEVEKLAG